MFIKLAVALILPISLFVIFIALLKQRYRQAGVQLLVIPMSKFRRFMLIGLSTILIILGFYIQSPLISAGSIGLASSYLIDLFCPEEMRENGIITYGYLIRWSLIQSYEWKSSEELLLKFKRRNWWYKRWKIWVPQAKQLQVDQILRSKLI